MEADKPPAVKSAARTVELLEALAQAPGRLTLTELAGRLGYPKSSIHMLLRTLVGAGWVESDERGTAYGIGVRALLVGTAFLDRDVVNQVATAHLAALRAHLNETVHLEGAVAVIELGQCVPLDVPDGARQLDRVPEGLVERLGDRRGRGTGEQVPRNWLRSEE